MLQEVRRATVVVVNPEHVAVALAYEREGSGAPRIIAKGERLIAQEIVRLARESGVPVVRNVPLAQALSRLELGEEVPEELYEAVAEVLHFVYRLEGERRGG
jgi:flagellar biosynthetic protein FlhB